MLAQHTLALPYFALAGGYLPRPPVKKRLEVPFRAHGLASGSVQVCQRTGAVCFGTAGRAVDDGETPEAQVFAGIDDVKPRARGNGWDQVNGT